MPTEPSLPYQPTVPTRYRPGIGLIGCGGITKHHLEAYQADQYDVVALCDLDVDRAESRRREYYPDATVYCDYHDLLRRDDIEVVDVATHPAERTAIVADALRARKHVLSQKPFVLDLAVGQQLVDLADQYGVILAVNQNGRWAPHFSYLRQAHQHGWFGTIDSLQMSVQWDHTWIAGTPFEAIHHLILYDFAIHWFDMVTCLLGPATRVFASVHRTAQQRVAPPLLAQVVIDFPHAQASLLFAAETQFGPLDHTYLSGSHGSFESRGPSYKEQQVTVWRGDETIQPVLQGSWFSDGFRGTMGELLCAIQDRRSTSLSGRDNLSSLALCFAAVASANSGQPMIPGQITQLTSAPTDAS